MKDYLPILTLFLNLLTPDPAMKNVRLEKKELKLELKKIRIAERMRKKIRKEFKEDGFTEEENRILDELQAKINQRRAELV